MSRSRSWCFTLNNYTQADEDLLQNDSSAVRYVCYGREVGESGTPHLQGFIYFNNPCALSLCRERVGNAHCEIARGTTKQAVEYCKKDGDCYERGSAPLTSAEKGEAEKERWDRSRDAAKEGRLDDIDSDIYVRYYRTLKDIKRDHMSRPEDAAECTGMWITGLSGVGKSYKARQDYPDAYFKMANKWWDGYQGEENVIIDDLDVGHACLGHHLKIWADRYSFVAETKGGATMIRPTKIIVTSQYRIDQIWTDAETVDALKRRFQIILLE